jgi:murein endopeptidase
MCNNSNKETQIIKMYLLNACVQKIYINYKLVLKHCLVHGNIFGSLIQIRLFFSPHRHFKILLINDMKKKNLTPSAECNCNKEAKSVFKQ